MGSPKKEVLKDMNKIIIKMYFKEINYALSRNNIDKAKFISDNSIVFNINGSFHHRITLPAAITKSGGFYWFKNDLRHNIHGPAVINVNEERHYFFKE